MCVCVRKKVQSGGHVSGKNQWNLGALLVVPDMYIFIQPNTLQSVHLSSVKLLGEISSIGRWCLRTLSLC